MAFNNVLPIWVYIVEQKRNLPKHEFKAWLLSMEASIVPTNVRENLLKSLEKDN